MDGLAPRGGTDSRSQRLELSTGGCARASRPQAARSIRPRNHFRSRQHLQESRREFYRAARTPINVPKLPPSFSSARACNAPNATTIRSTAGARTITTIGSAFSPGEIQSAREPEARRQRRPRIQRRTNRLSSPSAEVKNPRTGGNANRASSAKPSPRRSEDELTASPNGPPAQRIRSSRAQVNRIWYHLFGRGLIEPLDDFPRLKPGVASRTARRTREGLRQSRLRSPPGHPRDHEFGVLTSFPRRPMRRTKMTKRTSPALIRAA